MTRRMLINAQRTDEVRIAIVTGKTLDSYEVSATDSGLCRGNIYRGIVAKVQPSLDAAFVDFGADRDGLLRADDVVPSAYLRKQDADTKHPRIDRILERGQVVLVQVVRDGVGHKGALVDTNLSIAGRYLVLMPLDPVRGVSRKVEDETERTNIRERLDRLDLPDGCGVIVRTNAADQPQRSLNRDLSALLRLWKKVRDESTIGKGPRLLYSDQDLIVQALRDSVDATIDEILVDDAAAFAKAEGFMQTFMPRGRSRLIHYTDRLPLFSRYELESQIERIYLRKVDLPSGGSIVIDGTEALTAIDVNSGRATRGGSQEETAHATNMEAAVEVARQLRMRDIGGLVVVDFIDMRSSKHRRNVEKAMRDAMKDDKAKNTASRLSDNGLLEINRQRLKKALQLRTHRPCPTCGGAGTIPSSELIGLNVLRRIETRAVTGRLKAVRVSLHPELADAIQNDRRKELADLEREFDIRVEIIAATSLHRSDERFEWTERSDAPTGPRVATAAVSAADLADGMHEKSKKPTDQVEDKDEPEEAPAKAEKPGRKRRRGGRKRRKAGGAAEEPADAEAAPEPSEAAKPAADADSPGGDDDDGDDNGKPARKRRRGGRKRRKKTPKADTGSDAEAGAAEHDSSGAEETADAAPEDGSAKAPKSRRRRPRRARKPKAGIPPELEQAAGEPDPTTSESQPSPTPPGDDPFAY